MNSYLRINTNTSAVVSSVACVLKRIVINKKGASSNVLNVYDGAAINGTLVASIDTTTAVGDIECDIALNRGMFINIPNVGTAADVTIVYK